METGVLALHGFTGSPSELAFLTDRIERAGFPVRAPLLPGHGTTERDLQHHTWGDWLTQAREELAHAHAEFGKVIVCGFSMGSLVALALAAGDTRDQVGGLVILGCALELAPAFRAAFAIADRMKLRLPDAYMPKPFGPDIRDKTLVPSMESYARQPIRAAQEVYRAGRRISAELDRVTCPTLILHGERDHVCSIKGARMLAEKIGTRDVRLITYPNSAHVLPLDYDREAVARDVISFLERVAYL